MGAKLGSNGAATAGRTSRCFIAATGIAIVPWATVGDRGDHGQECEAKKLTKQADWPSSEQGEHGTEQQVILVGKKHLVTCIFRIRYDTGPGVFHGKNA